MKKLILTTLLLGFNVSAYEGKMQESVFIQDLSALKQVSQHSKLIIDHPSPEGFELYGPKGMKEWLVAQQINFLDVEVHAHEKNDEFNGYPSFNEVTRNLKRIVAKNPNIAKLFSIGKSVEGRELWVVKISDNVNVDEVEPEFKYISSMHGDEITGRELTQFMIEDIIDGYGTDQGITELVNNTEIFIMPSMNPDGSERKQRANAKGYDLNRNFPDWIRGDQNSQARKQPETQAVMAFQAQRNFALSANFHGGAVVVNYPWDNTKERHPLDKLLQELSLKYADLNPAMRGSRSFPRGITNGADWYVLNGGMQDWSYFWYNDLQVTVELSQRKWPRYNNIPSFYRDNKQSMLAYLEAVHQGAGFKFSDRAVQGQVSVWKKLSDGTKVDQGRYGFSGGEFYKVLAQGEYQFHITVDGVLTKLDVMVSDEVKPNGNYQQL